MSSESITNWCLTAFLSYHGIKCRSAIILTTELAGAGRRSERPGAVGQPNRFSKAVEQTQGNVLEPKLERDFEVLLPAVRGQGEEFHLLGVPVYVLHQTE